MRILHVTSSLDPIGGGVSMAVAGMAGAQAAYTDLKVTVVSTYVAAPGGVVADELRRKGATVVEIQAREPRSSHPDLPRTLAVHVANADVVHVHAMWEEIQYHAPREARRARVPYVMTPHGMLDPWNLNRRGGWKKKLYLALRMSANLKRAAAIHFTTSEERDRTLGVLKLRTNSIVEPLGIDLTDFEPLPQRGEFRSRYPQLGDRPIVLFLGRIEPKKGLDLLVPAFAKAKVGDAMLVIAGPDERGYKSEIERLVRENSLSDRVLFVGMVRGRDRARAMRDAELFVLSSYIENFGMTVTEALACGTPVIVSDQVNIHHEVAAAGVGGVVPTKIDALGSELTRWMGDAALRESAASKARAFVMDMYDWNKIAQHWAGHYARIAAR